MTIFDFINSVCFYKKYTNVETQSTFSAFMLQRWISMYSSQVAVALNETINCLWKSVEGNQMWFDTFYVLIPLLKYKKISYIKKVASSEDSKHELVVQKLSNLCQISFDEARLMIEMEPKIIQQFEEGR